MDGVSRGPKDCQSETPCVTVYMLPGCDLTPALISFLTLVDRLKMCLKSKVMWYMSRR